MDATDRRDFSGLTFWWKVITQSIGQISKSCLTKVADAALTVGEAWGRLPAFAVDAVIAYGKPGARLDEGVEFSVEGMPSVVLATGRYKGRTDVGLVALGLSPADIKDDGKSVILDIPDDRLIEVPDFPSSDGWYMPHERTGVPHGKGVKASEEARFLWRLDDSPYVGLLVRSAERLNRRSIYASCVASARFGVVAEVPERDAMIFEADTNLTR